MNAVNKHTPGPSALTHRSHNPQPHERMKTKKAPRPSPRKMPKARATQAKIAFARAKAITAMAEYCALLQKPKEKANKAKPHAIIRGLTGASFEAGHNMMLGYSPFGDSDCCVVVPLPTAKQSRALARWLNMSEEEMVEAVANAVSLHEGLRLSQRSDYMRRFFRDTARAILSLQGLITGGEK